MKKFISFILIFQIVFSKSFSQANKELELFCFDKSNTIKNKITLFQKTDSNQIKSQNGIKFSIRLKNKTKDSLKIRNVLDFVTIHLYNEKQENVSIKSISRIYTDSKIFKNEAFDIESSHINGESVIDSIEYKEFITIPPLGNYEIFFRTTKVLKTINTVNGIFEKIIIEQGIYLLTISVGIIIDNKLSTYSSLPKKISYIDCNN